MFLLDRSLYLKVILVASLSWQQDYKAHYFNSAEDQKLTNLKTSVVKLAL